jgi:hypothetical protein
MKKLQVKTDDGWKCVFCYDRNGLVLTDNKRKALPPRAEYGQDDLQFFSRKFGNNEFRLA